MPKLKQQSRYSSVFMDFYNKCLAVDPQNRWLHTPPVSSSIHPSIGRTLCPYRFVTSFPSTFRYCLPECFVSLLVVEPRDLALTGAFVATRGSAADLLRHPFLQRCCPQDHIAQLVQMNKKKTVV